MKVKYVKFSDERRREFCIKTVIGKDSGIWKVRKTAIFEEGVPHIKILYIMQSFLKNIMMRTYAKLYFVIIQQNLSIFQANLWKKNISLP